jgi:aminobenzoyl-glutamate utilization protein B
MATQTRARFSLVFGLYDLLPNTPLAQRTFERMQEVGVPQWTEDEQAFARECQRSFGAAEVGMIQQPLPFIPDRSEGGSSDVGDVSWNAPTVAFIYPSFPLGIGLHTWPVTACGGMSIGTKSAIGAADIMTRVGLDLLTDEELRTAARADFDARRAGKAYRSPLLDIDATPAMIHEAEHQPKDGSDDLFEQEQGS